MNVPTKVKFPRVIRPMAVLRSLVCACEDSEAYQDAVRKDTHSVFRRTVDAAIEYLVERGD